MPSCPNRVSPTLCSVSDFAATPFLGSLRSSHSEPFLDPLEAPFGTLLEAFLDSLALMFQGLVRIPSRLYPLRGCPWRFWELLLNALGIASPALGVSSGRLEKALLHSGRLEELPLRSLR